MLLGMEEAGRPSVLVPLRRRRARTLLGASSARRAVLDHTRACPCIGERSQERLPQLLELGRAPMAAPQFSCSTFTDRGTTYFAAVTLHGGPEGSADLSVTDGASAWTAQGAGGRCTSTHAYEPGLRSRPVLGVCLAEVSTSHAFMATCRADIGGAERRAGRPPEAPPGGADRAGGARRGLQPQPEAGGRWRHGALGRRQEQGGGY